VWLRCPGCSHGCGKQHEWEARIYNLTRPGGLLLVCPCCVSRGGGFCECRSVQNDPQLSKEWHPSNPPAGQVAKGSTAKYIWVCPKGHPPYKAQCHSRSLGNTGCPVCGAEEAKTTRHPVLSVGRPDLAEEWDTQRNLKTPSEVTLGSDYRAWWVCSCNPEHPAWQARVKTRAMRGSNCPACRTRNRFKPRIYGPVRA